MPPSPGPALAHALLLTALLGAPAAPARAADGFTEIGSPFPRREAGLPGDDAEEEAAEAEPGADPEADPLRRAARQRAAAAAAAAEEDEWSAWWREWRGWSPFAVPRAAPQTATAAPPPGTPPSQRIGASASPPDPGPPTSPFLPFWPLLAGLAPPAAPTPQSAPGTASGAIALFAGPPPAQATPPVIGEPTSMAILGGALAALGLLRRRRRAPG